MQGKIYTKNGSYSILLLFVDFFKKQCGINSAFPGRTQYRQSEEGRCYLEKNEDESEHDGAGSALHNVFSMKYEHMQGNSRKKGEAFKGFFGNSAAEPSSKPPCPGGSPGVYFFLCRRQVPFLSDTRAMDLWQNEPFTACG
jgi:hypothetical protein